MHIVHVFVHVIDQAVFQRLRAADGLTGDAHFH
jgi:hypothetical protein